MASFGEQSPPPHLDIADLPDVYEATIPVQAHWHDLGLALHIPVHELETAAVSAREPKDALKRVLTVWLSRVTPEPNWQSLVTAIGGRIVGRGTLAAEIARLHCPDFRVGGAGTEAGGATSLGGGPGSNSEGGVATSERGGAEEVIEADRHLTPEDHLVVADYLQDLDADHLYKVALRLGIKHANAKRMKASAECCYDVVSAWLLGQDNVPTQCPPTWRNLERVLRHRAVGQTGIANRIKDDMQL